MIIIFLLINSEIDSLKILFKESPSFNLIMEINKFYLMENELDTALNFLIENSKFIKPEEQPFLYYLVGEDLFFGGRILEAREEYLKTVARFSSSEIANDALERLYLIEVGRRDTLQLKNLARAIFLIEVGNTQSARDSLGRLIKTNFGDYALYYLALINFNENKTDDALKNLNQLQKEFPENKIKKAEILRARIFLKMGNKVLAREVLENLILKESNSVYGIQAREILKNFSP
uniref:Tetratricopeptide repeat protein n=1 Tax=candidate division WOR-3 bacterium TaxID=2052148 RepID=A0A7C4TD80_UNCW3